MVQLRVENLPQTAGEVFGTVAALAMMLGSTTLVAPSALAADTMSLQQELDARARRAGSDIPTTLSASDDPSEPFVQQYKYKVPVHRIPNSMYHDRRLSHHFCDAQFLRRRAGGARRR